MDPRGFAAVKPLGSMLSLSRWLFSAQDAPRKNLKFVQNRREMSFLNMFLEILYDVCSQNGNEKCRTTYQQRKMALKGTGTLALVAVASLN
jgi:hypothetical protein